jgi:uncharacterized membrane protein
MPRYVWGMVDVEEKEVGLAVGILEDCRRYIAAHKIQRWEILKWGVSVNVALAVAAAVPALKGARLLLLVFGCAVSTVSCLLISYYNKRMAGMRRQAVGIVNWLTPVAGPAARWKQW